MSAYLKVGESFVGKLGTSQDYAWLYEGLEHVEVLTDDDIRQYVEVQSQTIYDMYDADCMEAGREALPYDQWKAASDYEDAVQAVVDARAAVR